MNPRSPSRFLRLSLVCAGALALAAPAGGRSLPVEGAHGGTVARYGWGAAATVAKRQSKGLLAQYGWGAAAAYAKLRS